MSSENRPKEFTDSTPLNFSVITNRGIIPIGDIKPGDFVYHYRDGHPMEVESVIPLPTDTIYNVIYSDGRVSRYHWNHAILYDCGIAFNDDSISSVADLVKYDLSHDSQLDHIFGTIRQFQISWNNGTVRKPLEPNPYVAGPLIIYGDFKDRYANLPDVNDMKSIAQKFVGMHESITCMPWCAYEKVYLSKHEGATNEEVLISWDELFEGFNPKSWCLRYKDHPTMMVSIPDQYMYASPEDRIDFIRGVFDCGYYPERFPDHPGIIGNDEFRFKELQKMLLSLGIFSRITHDPILATTVGMGVCLEILNSKTTNLFRNREYISMMLDADNMKVNSNNKPFRLIPVIFKETNHRASSFDLVLHGEDRYGVYLSANYIPRPSA